MQQSIHCKINKYPGSIQHLLIIGLLFIIISCRKKDDPVDAGKEEANRIESTMKNKKFVVDKMVDGQGNDASSYFPTCIVDDTFQVKEIGYVEIKAGKSLCGKETTFSKQATWNIGYNEDRSVKGLFFPVFLKNQEYYSDVLFLKGNYELANTSTNQVALNLVFPDNDKRYYLKLIQIQ